MWQDFRIIMANRHPLTHPAVRLDQQSIPPTLDLREMLRTHVVGRSLACMERAEARRRKALESVEAFAAYRREIRRVVEGFYPGLQAQRTRPVEARVVGESVHGGVRIQNVLFDSFPDWEVNASVFVPEGGSGPFRCIVIPVGHSNKCMPSYQRSARYFARAGFLAITFDPPGCTGEKVCGNEHFADGVRDYLLGETSSRYFVADALRCIDYFATRPDADLTGGVAMTGVSGGGTTTTFAALLDDRIAVTGPSCCLTPLADLDITQGYCGCPETHAFGRYAEGIDEVDLLCAVAPGPCMLMAGEKDEVFRIDDTRRLAGMVEQAYALAGGTFRFFADPGGHAYSLLQAREFVGFLREHFGVESSEELPGISEEDFPLLPHETFRCNPDTSVNMRTLGVRQAREFAQGYASGAAEIHAAAGRLCGVTEETAVPEAELGAAFRVWTHDWHPLLLRPEPGIELPATWLTARDTSGAPTVLHFDDAGRHRLVHRNGPLADAIRFLDRGRPGFNLLTVDLRGWGDSAPAMFPYELAGWGAVDRTLAYASNALGDPLMAMRVRDGLAALAWLRLQPSGSSAPVVVSGSGLGGIVALHVTACAGGTGIAGVVTQGCLSSFSSLLAAETYPWTADAFLPGVIKHYDLPELAASLGCPAKLLGLRDGAGDPAPEPELARYRVHPQLTASAQLTGHFDLVEAIASIFS